MASITGCSIAVEFMEYCLCPSYTPPPLGIACYFIKSPLDDDTIRLSDIFYGAAPFALIMLLVLVLVIAFPPISLVLI